MRYKQHHRDPLTRNWRDGRFCKHCRKPYRRTAPHQKYCSHRCRSRAHRRRHRVRVLRCEGCRCEYLVHQAGSPGPRSKYCSQPCRQQAYRQRRKAREALARHSHVIGTGYQVDEHGQTWRITETLWGVRRQLVEDPRPRGAPAAGEQQLTGRPPGGTKVPD